MKYFLICAWIVSVFSAAANAENLRVRLLADVTVQAETLRLSDLLPADAGPRLKAAADKVSLGRAPQVGGLRVFTVSELRESVVEIPVYTSEIEIPQQVVVRRLGSPLETETVRRTLARSKLTHRLDLSQARLTLPPGFTTAASNPQFEVTALKPSSDHRRLLAQIRCLERTACGSFLVEIAFSESAGLGRSSQLKQASEKTAEPDLLSTASPVFVQPGRLALLVIDGDGFRVTQAVMPLKRARLGELVRVTDRRTHRGWLAQVSGEGLLRLSGATRNEEVQ